MRRLWRRLKAWNDRRYGCDRERCPMRQDKAFMGLCDPRRGGCKIWFTN